MKAMEHLIGLGHSRMALIGGRSDAFAMFEKYQKYKLTHGAMAVSAASKNPERALMVYDLLRNDPDCYQLFNYGIQGVSWDVNDEGLRITSEDYNSDTQNINGMTNWWWGRNDNLEIKDATRNGTILTRFTNKIIINRSGKTRAY